MAHWRLAGPAFCLAALLNGEALGDDPGRPIPLPPVVVPLPPAEPAPETPRRRDPTGSITRVEMADHQGEAKDAAELLATAPGALLQDLGGLGQMKTVSLRGASPNGVLVFLDGIPLNGSGGQVDLARIPPALIDHLEVLRGGSGARYGSGGLGGAVDIVTRAPKAGAELGGEATYGSFGTELAQASGTGTLAGGEGLALVHFGHTDGTFDYFYNPTPQLSNAPLVEGVRQNNDATFGGGLFKYRRPLGGGWIDAMLEASAESRGLAGTVENPTPDSREQSQRGAATVRASRELEHGEVSARAFYRHDDIDLRGGLFSTGVLQHESAAGVELSASQALGIHGLEATAQLTREGLVDPSGVDPTRWTVSAMASDQLRLGRFTFVPSLRFDQAGPFTGFSPKLGASVRLPRGFSVKANAGQAFRAPSFLELYVAQGNLLPNPTLQPERALFADGAVAYEHRAARLSVGGFYSLYENLISYEYYPPLLAKPYNFYTAAVEGLEAEGELQPRPWASGALGYTLMFSQNLRDDPRYYLKELPYRPRHTLYARIAGGPLWARARAEVVYQSEQYINRTQTVALPPRAFLNAGISSQVGSSPQVVASLELKNALDTHAEDFDGYPLPGRALYLTVSVAWERRPDDASLSRTIK